MALVRCIMEMGMGVDVHGRDYTNGAKRAVFDALHHSSLGFQRLIGKTADDMQVEVTIGSPQPSQVDTAAVVATLPHGTATSRINGLPGNPLSIWGLSAALPVNQ